MKAVRYQMIKLCNGYGLMISIKKDDYTNLFKLIFHLKSKIMFGVIPMTIIWFIVFLFALRQRNKYETLAQNATEPEEINALKKLVTRHTTRAILYGLFFAAFLIMLLMILTVR
jgi:predicted secreted protein